jgi:hypothetical protein
VTITSSDWVEVESPELGTQTWQVRGAPIAVRGTSGIVGFRVPLWYPATREEGFS